MRNRIILVIIILAVSAGLIGYLWQRQSFSKGNLNLEILSKREVGLAEEVEYTVKYKNNGAICLEEPRLVFEYPKQALVPDDKPLRQEIILDDIYPGVEKTISFKARLLGREGENITAKATLSYRPRNLKPRYESDTTFTTIIKSVPVTFELDLPSKVESAKSFNFRINYFSNLDYPLTDLRVQTEYPSGFEFIESTPKSLEKDEWLVSILNKNQGGRIEITGKVSGQISEARIFIAKLGVLKEGEFILLKEVEKGLEIIKPLIYIRQEINRNPQYMARPGDWLHYEIYFKNIGENILNDIFVMSHLEGAAFDLETIRSDLGEADPGLSSVIFDGRKISQLQYLLPMEEKKVDFWIKVKDDFGPVEKPILINKISVNDVKEEFITKISSKVEIAQKGFFKDEVFGNRGPIPPRVGEATTYTIIWQVKNYYSLVKDIKTKAILPPGVELAGKIFPGDEATKFSFDSQSREIIWSVGDLEKGSAKDIAFQVSFTPNAFQRGQTPKIINAATITGEDSWTDRILEATSPAIDTTLPDDETITEDMGKVQ